jgi:uncharacterized protein (TIGR03435 family)
MNRIRQAMLLATLSAIPCIQAQTPKFEVASIKRNPACPTPNKAVPTPGRVMLECSTLQMLIQAAYGMFANGTTRDARLLEVSGAPGWVQTEFYDVSAKAEGNPRIEQMIGPMMQALLEERFKLKLHRATKEAAVYDLTVAKGGPKLEKMKEGSCVVQDLNHMPKPAPGETPPVYCGSQTLQRKGPLMVMIAHGMTMDGFAAERLPRMAGRPVVDKTGLAGRFDFQLEWALDNPELSGRGGDAPESAGPTIFAALQQQLGLKLEPAKGSVDILVVDHVEKPTEN